MGRTDCYLYFRFPALSLVLLLLISCSAQTPVTNKENEVQLDRSYNFENAEKKIVFYSLVSTLEEFGYTLSSVDLKEGIVIADIKPPTDGFKTRSGFVRQQIKKQQEVRLTASVQPFSDNVIRITVDFKPINVKPNKPKRRAKRKYSNDYFQKVNETVGLGLTQSVYKELYKRIGEIVAIES